MGFKKFRSLLRNKINKNSVIVFQLLTITGSADLEDRHLGLIGDPSGIINSNQQERLNILTRCFRAISHDDSPAGFP